ncbi:MAG: hypothetical protein ACXVZU_02520 [Methanobacteriaceae archaeon]|jgi:hypothetical protein
MRPETNGKLAVGLIVSLLAFGLGTGTAIFSGFNSYSNNLTTTNITPPGELPPIFTTTNPINTSQNNLSSVQSNPSTNQEKVYVEHPSNQSTVTPTPNQTENQSQPP